MSRPAREPLDVNGEPMRWRKCDWRQGGRLWHRGDTCSHRCRAAYAAPLKRVRLSPSSFTAILVHRRAVGDGWAGGTNPLHASDLVLRTSQRFRLGRTRAERREPPGPWAATPETPPNLVSRTAPTRYAPRQRAACPEHRAVAHRHRDAMAIISSGYSEATPIPMYQSTGRRRLFRRGAARGSEPTRNQSISNDIRHNSYTSSRIVALFLNSLGNSHTTAPHYAR
jgi:hypothetical protein